MESKVSAAFLNYAQNASAMKLSEACFIILPQTMP